MSADTAAPAFRVSAMVLSVLLCIAQAIVTVTAINTVQLYPNSTLIPVIGFGLVFILALTVNPVIRIVFRGWLRPLGRVELMSMTAALMVTAGVSAFGLSQVLVPLIPTPWNPEWNVPQRGWDQSLLPNLRSELYITDAKAIQGFRQGIGRPPADGAPLGQQASYYWRVACDIPWSLWLGPLGLWMIFIAGCYGIFWSLTQVMIGQWSNHEKLIFPLAKLPEGLLPASDGAMVPDMAKSGLFWAGFALAAGVLMYNAAAKAQLIPLSPLPLGMGVAGFNAIVEHSIFSGLGHGVTWLVIFTCIGIAFLLPQEISFSVWFYFWVGRFIILALTWMGYGQNFRDFPSDWMWVQNPVAAMGMGAMLLFSAITLHRGLRGYLKSTAKRGLKRWPLVGLAISVAVVVGWIRWNHIPWVGSILLVGFVILITVGLMRIVAETGIFWHQINAGFFHFYKMLGLAKLVPAMLVAPLIPIYAVLFFDIKTFIAPSVINAEKMQRDVGGSRWRFHLNIMICLAASIVVSIGHSILMAYTRGAQNMSTWFYSTGPLRYFEEAARVPGATFRFTPSTFGWFTAGAAWVALSMFLRQTCFWFPHPIGFLMNINPLMQYLWFSFFIGWVAKKAATRYGGKQTFDTVRPLMLGLIFGELMVIFILGVMTLIWPHMQVTGIDLNRYGP